MGTSRASIYLLNKDKLIQVAVQTWATLLAPDVSMFHLFSTSRRFSGATGKRPLPSPSLHGRNTKRGLRTLTRIILASSQSGEGVPGGTGGKEPPANAGDTRDPGSTPGLQGSPGGGDGPPLQYSCLENSMDRGAWQAIQSMGSQRLRHN